MNQSHAISTLNSYAHLSNLKVPVLILTGDDDVLVPRENSEKIASQIPGSELVTIPGCGHGFLKQKTDEAVGHILRFLDNVEC